MSRGVNKAILVGNLGKDPELRHTQNGNAVCSFSLATTEKRKQGEKWEDHTEWHNIVVFSKQAEACSAHLQKGSTVYLEGRLQTRKWQDKEGRDRWNTEVVADEVVFLGGGQRAEPAPAKNAEPDAGDPNDDIPF